MTLRARIAALAGLSVALAVLAVAVGLYLGVRADLRGEIDQSLRQRARSFTAPPPDGGPPPPDGDGRMPPPPSTIAPAPFGGAEGYVQFLTTQGAVQVPGGQSTSSQIPPSASDATIARRGNGSTLSDRTVRGTRLRVLTQSTGARGAMMVARPLGEVESELSSLLTLLAAIGGASIALAALLGALVARTALAPIVRFTRRTEQLASAGAEGGGLAITERLEVPGRDELARLAESFNTTLDALERSLESQRQLIADAGHELRTPIASLRVNIQVLGEAARLPAHEQESLRRDIVEELDELTALVGDVVELARGGVRGPAREPAEADEVRLDEVVHEALERARRRSDVRWRTEIEPTLVSGQAQAIGRAVSNLLDNACKWSPAQGLVEVRLKDGELTIRDHGPGFQPADLPFVFDRFYRAHDARRLPGSGLGLAIVRQAAQHAGGYARAENAPGGGALLRVSFGAPLDLASPEDFKEDPTRGSGSGRVAPT
jgi:two-component system sensor histidine kinase MprB